MQYLSLGSTKFSTSSALEGIMLLKSKLWSADLWNAVRCKAWLAVRTNNVNLTFAACSLLGLSSENSTPRECNSLWTYCPQWKERDNGGRGQTVMNDPMQMSAWLQDSQGKHLLGACLTLYNSIWYCCDIPDYMAKEKEKNRRRWKEKRPSVDGGDNLIIK